MYKCGTPKCGKSNIKLNTLLEMCQQCCTVNKRLLLNPCVLTDQLQQLYRSCIPWYNVYDDCL